MTHAPGRAAGCAITGHRPARYAFSEDETHPHCHALKLRLREQLLVLLRAGITDFYCGMAQGADLWAAETLLDLRETHPELCLNCMLPCQDQDKGWPEHIRMRYLAAVLRADRVIYTSQTYTRGCMQLRNRAMVDAACHLLAVYDGGTKGGTAYTVAYALKRGLPVTVIHPNTLRVTPPQQLTL